MTVSKRVEWRYVGPLLFSVVLFIVLGPALRIRADQTCPDFKGQNMRVCEGTYALCPAASCDDDGWCGVKTADDRGSQSAPEPCNQSGLDDGSCGPCYVFNGKSCSYADGKRKPLCPGAGLVLGSTYSGKLVDDFGFQWAPLPAGLEGWDCMDAQCEPTGTLTLKTSNGSKVVNTAMCKCRPWSTKMTHGGRRQQYLQVPACSANISASKGWSTGFLPVEKPPVTCPAKLTTAE